MLAVWSASNKILLNPSYSLGKAIELIENGKIEEEGRKARKFVEKYSWDSIVDEFERILEELI